MTVIRQIGAIGSFNNNILDQQLGFIIGPSATNTLISGEDYDTRLEEVKKLTEPNTEHYLNWIAALEKALDAEISKISFFVGPSGKRGLICPSLSIDLYKSETSQGEILLNYFTPQSTVIIIRTLIKLFDADWVDALYTGGFGNHQINCERNADAIWFKAPGKTEVLK